MGRAPCCDKANVKKGPWSLEEDATLKAFIDKYGTGGNWIALPQKIGLKRCGKSCRLRWLNYLRPNIKHGGFSEEEDKIICNLYISIGSRWSIIAAQLPGRTDNDIKNYWNTRLKKKLLGRRKQMNRQDSNDSNDHNQNSQTLSNSALERLQLHMQLQSLQNPFSLYNNPSSWPKLHPLQEKMIQSLQSLNEISPNSLMQQPALLPQPAGHERKVDFYDHQAAASVTFQEDFPKITNPKVLGLGNNNNSLNGISSWDGSASFTVGKNLDSNSTSVPKADIHQVPDFQSELDDFINNNKTISFAFQEDQLADQYDCFKEMNKDSLIWWPNEFGAKSACSNSWDSASVLHPEGMFQDYELGYDM